MQMSTRSVAPGPRIAAIGLLLGALLVAATPSPAVAHGVGGVDPSNYRTRVTSIDPSVAGVVVRPVDLGTRLELTNRGETDVVVLGYDGEPYLRVGPRGVFENTRSPATYLNRSLRVDEASEPVPATADPDAAPRWRRVDDGRTARWHDHRAHWMGRADPPVVQRDPDRGHLIQRFEVELRQGPTAIVVRGDVRWVPGHPPWPWIVGAIVLAGLVVAASRRRRATQLVAGTLGLVAVGEALHVIGSWGGTTLATGDRLGASVYAIGAIVLSVVACISVLRRGLDRAAPLVLVAGLFVALAGGLADVTALARSGIPTTLASDLARATVMLALGAGLGLAAVGGLRLRVPDGPR
ncbi:MAG TPA: hypothetical protein VFW06_00780 [Acidimicrobiia bacterium]|nr:hypothetical protein [Acidimicrobiia bacterium]